MITNNYLRKKKKTIFYKRILISMFFLLGIILFVFNDMGLIKYFQLKKQNQKLIEDINIVRNERKKLSKKIGKLENDLEYIEKIAREEFRMAKEGEKVFRVIHKDSNEENQP